MSPRPRTRPPAAPPPEDNAQALVDALDGMFRRMMFNKDSRDFSRIDTTPIESRALHWLSRQGGALMSEFAKALDIPVSTATNLANRLVEKGYVARERPEDDRRVVRVTLSAGGRRMIQRLRQMRLEASRDTLATLQPSEQSTLIELLRKTAVEGDPGNC